MTLLLLQPRFDGRMLLYTFSLIFVLKLLFLWSSGYSLLSAGKTRFALLVISGAQVTYLWRQWLASWLDFLVSSLWSNLGIDQGVLECTWLRYCDSMMRRKWRCRLRKPLSGNFEYMGCRLCKLWIAGDQVWNRAVLPQRHFWWLRQYHLLRQGPVSQVTGYQSEERE